MGMTWVLSSIFSPCLSFSACKMHSKQKRKAKLLFSDLQKTGTNIWICANICFYVVRAECSLCCRPSPGSHCHTSVECRSSAPIDLEAHDPIFKVQRAPLLWFLLLLKQATARERERATLWHKTTSARFTPTPQLLETPERDSKVSNESVSTSGGFQLQTQIKLRHQNISGPNLPSPSHHIAGTDKKESAIRWCIFPFNQS